MEAKLNFIDKYITPRTKEYKDFVKELENTPPEQFFRDGERKFTKEEQKFLAIYEYKKEKYNGINNYNPNEQEIVGGKIQDIAGKSLTDSNYLHLFDNGTKNTIVEYLKVTPNVEKIPLSANDYLAISDRWNNEMNKPTEMSKGMNVNEISEKMSNYYALYEINLKKEQNQLKNNNMEAETQAPKENRQFDQVEYLKNQMKYLGFGEDEKLHKDLEAGINSDDKKFQIHTTSDKTLPNNKVDFTLNFSKSEQGGVFFNSFKAVLKTDKGEERSHNFGVNHFTAKEAINLLEGRSVKTEFEKTYKDTGEITKNSAFVKLNFAGEKTEYGNYKMDFYKANDIDTEKIIEKSNIVIDKPEFKDRLIKSLEKGNVVNAKFIFDNKEIEGKVVLNPQYKNLNLYDKEMNRLNTNKPIQGLEQGNEQASNRVKQQSISRGIG